MERIFKEALELKPEEKIKLIELLYQSLLNTEKDIEQLWMEESEKRFELLKSGKTKTISIEEIKKKLNF